MGIQQTLSAVEVKGGVLQHPLVVQTESEN